MSINLGNLGYLFNNRRQVVMRHHVAPTPVHVPAITPKRVDIYGLEQKVRALQQKVTALENSKAATKSASSVEEVTTHQPMNVDCKLKQYKKNIRNKQLLQKSLKL